MSSRMPRLALVVLALISLGSSPAAASNFVVDGSDVAVYLNDPAPLLFRIQNNTGADATFDYQIAMGMGSILGQVTVPALKDALIEEVFAGSPVPGDFLFTLTLTPVPPGPALGADLLVQVRSPVGFPSAVTDESDVTVDEPLQKPIIIVTPAGPQPKPGPIDADAKFASSAMSGGGSPARSVNLTFTVVVQNPDNDDPNALFNVTPTSGNISAPPGTPVTLFLTISLPSQGVRVGTVNTVTIAVTADGNTVRASGQAIYQGSCAGAPPTCSPGLIPSRWGLSTYDDYPAPGELRSFWCGSLTTGSLTTPPGYGSCWDASAYLRLGTAANFSAAGGMTLGGVQLYSTERAHDLCMIDLGTGSLPSAVTNWRRVATWSGISNPDSVSCPPWTVRPHLCARYEPFLVAVPPGLVPDNSSTQLWVRWRFASDLTKDDQGNVLGLDTKGAWRIDHLSVRGDLSPNSYYPPDASRLALQKFESTLPGTDWVLPQTIVYDCTAVDGPGGPGDGFDSAAGADGPRIAVEPNPSPGVVRLRFRLASPGAARVTIYDVAGRAVRDLPLGSLPAGAHVLEWDGRSREGLPVASGHYVARLVSGSSEEAARISILRR